jgi:hypothetical protein
LDFCKDCAVAKTAMFYSTFLVKMLSLTLWIQWKRVTFTSSLNTLYTAIGTLLYSAFLLLTIIFTRHCCLKRKVSLRFFAKGAEYDPKMHSHEDNAKFHCTFLVIALSYATHIQEWYKFWISEQLFKKSCQKMFAILCLVSINTQWCKKVENILWKSCACVPLRTWDYVWTIT